MSVASPLRTLVVAPSWVGDTVMAWPVLDAVAASSRQLVVLARTHLHPLLRLHGSAPQLIAHHKRELESTVAAIREARCDEALVLPSSFRSAHVVQRAGIPRRFGYRGDWRRLLLSPAVPRPSRRRPQVEDYRELLDVARIPTPVDWTPRISLDLALADFASGRLTRAGIGGDERPLVGLFPGAEFGPSKRWPLERFAAVARELRRRSPGGRCLIVAGPKEVWLAVRVHESSGKVCPVIGAELDLAELAAVLARLDLLITNDSGPMHLAAALGVPCLALFGPTDPGRTAPAGEGHAVLASERWCAPCFRRRCPLLHHRCLRDISVDRVVDHAVALLRRPR